MNKQVKGLLKGLRYISNIFEEEKEQEMQIGFPTDVKHVAHIGFDGPAVNNNPTWMNEFHSAPLSTSFSSDVGSLASSPKSVSQEIPIGQPQPESPSSKPQRRSRRHANSSPEGAAGSESPARPRHSRRGSESSADGSARCGRRSKNSAPQPGSESPTPEIPSVPKQNRRRKTKVGSSEGGSDGRSSNRSKSGDVEAGPEDTNARRLPLPLPALAAVAE